MASIKKSHFGALDSGVGVDAYTLRNTKGTEVKVIPFGARLVSWRTMAKSYRFVDILRHKELNVLATSDRGAVVFADGTKGAENIMWNAEELYEGVKFTHTGDDFSGSVLYSLSNDNELSIIMETDGKKLSHKGVFAMPISTLNVFSADYQGEKTGRWQIKDEIPEIVMEPGMFGYDPTCPIDYYDAGLRRAVLVESEEMLLSMTAFCTGLNCTLTLESMDTGILLGDADTNTAGDWKGQTVYALKIMKR